MDNQNNPNFPNTPPPNPSSPFGMPTQPSPAPIWPPTPQNPTPTWTPPVQQTTPQPEPTQPLQSPVSNTWAPTPVASPPEPTSSWTPITTSTAPAWPTPQATPTPQLTASSWTPPVQQTPSQTEPTPTFTPPAAPAPTSESVTPPTEPTSSLSPLDNPWGSPAQPPPPPAQPSWMGVNTNPAPTESIPTDLSHLISNNDSSQQQPTQSVPENLVVPSVPTSTPDVPTLPTQNHKGIPKLIIGLGAGLLVLVLGASAYFILGIGQPAQETTSIPATTAPQTAQVKPPAPVATPKPTQQPVASGSANFGQLGGSANASPAATSAADLLRQGQPRR